MNICDNIIFGPVPSRRLGQSIGINNIPPKRCTYSCIYCQLGRTSHIQINREPFYDPYDIITQTKEKIKKVQEKSVQIDYLALVPDGEPTLGQNLGRLINKLKELGYPVAVITNSSLLFMEDVRNELLFADWVSVKIDAIKETTWKKINRPHGALMFDKILEGILLFSNEFTNSLCTETMLIQDVNDNLEELDELASLIANLSPQTSYLSIPIRPPAETYVNPSSEKKLTEAYQLFTDHNIPTEYLIRYEGNEFAFTGNVEEDILSITSVHPMRQDAMEELLKKAGEELSLIDTLLTQGKIVKHILNDTIFYMRKLPKR